MPIQAFSPTLVLTVCLLTRYLIMIFSVGDLSSVIHDHHCKVLYIEFTLINKQTLSRLTDGYKGKLSFYSSMHAFAFRVLEFDCILSASAGNAI